METTSVKSLFLSVLKSICKIINSICNDFAFISCSPTGTHSIQSLVELITSNEEWELIEKCLQNNILNLCRDPNGTHVLQKIISRIREENREQLNQILLNNLNTLVIDQHGMCVIKQFILSNKNEEIRSKISQFLINDCLLIVQNLYGNYVMQTALEVWGQEYCHEFIKIIYSNLLTLSLQKYASNVVEKCFETIDYNLRSLWIQEIFNYDKVTILLKSKYGNYVLQRSLSIMSSIERKEVKNYLKSKYIQINKKEKIKVKALIDNIIDC